MASLERTAAPGSSSRTGVGAPVRTTAMRASEATRPDAKPRRTRAKLTRDGKVFVGITGGVGLAALNTGNNLLYLMFGLLLALLLLSLVVSTYSLRRLSVVRRLPVRAHVGTPHVVEIEVYNHKRRSPSYAVEVEDLRANLPADKRCFFLKISPHSAQVAAYRRTPQRRGKDHHTGFRLATRFPFGLFERSIELPSSGELIIYPAIDPVQLASMKHREGTLQPRDGRRGRGEEFEGVRPLRDGDDPRDIHWRKTAALGRPVLRERAAPSQPVAKLTLDTRSHGEPDAPAVFERRVREVASHAVAYVKRGDTVELRTTAGAALRSDRHTGADPLLRFLAFVELDASGGQ